MISLSKHQQRKLIQMYNDEVDNYYGCLTNLLMTMNKTPSIEDIKVETEMKKNKFRYYFEEDL